MLALRYGSAFVEQLTVYQENFVFREFRSTALKYYFWTTSSPNMPWYYEMWPIILHSIAAIPSFFMFYAAETIVVCLIVCKYFIVANFVTFYNRGLKDIEKYGTISDVDAVQTKILEILNAYDSLRGVFNLANKVFGIILIVDFPICLPIHVGGMGFLTQGEIHNRPLVVMMFLYYFALFMLMIAAAECHRKVK